MNLTQVFSQVRWLHRTLEKLDERQLETLEIVTDVDQMTTLLSGLLEARSGQVKPLSAAFSDL